MGSSKDGFRMIRNERNIGERRDTVMSKTVPRAVNKTEIIPLKEAGVLKSGGTPNKGNSIYWGGDYPWVTAKDLKVPVLKDSIDKLTDEGAGHAKIAPQNSLLILVRGMTLFKDVPICLASRDLAFNQDIKALVPKKGIDSNYLLLFLRSKKRELLGFVDSAGHGTGRLNIDLLKNLNIVLPPLPEQKAIADLLTTWDEVIEKMERLIKAKEKRFKRLLNDLINKGRNNHSWKGFNLSDLCSPITRKNNVNETNVLTSSAQNGLVSQMEYYNKSVSAENLTDYYLLKKGDFAYNRSSAKGYPYGAIKRLDKYNQGVLSTLYICFSLKTGAPCESDFLLYLFESGSLNRELRTVCQEGARSHGLLNITKTDFFGIKVFLPDQSEQKQIVSSLNAAQQEIELHKQLADKYKTQKRGLMQKMLTGVWRVKPEVVNKYMEV